MQTRLYFFPPNLFKPFKRVEINTEVKALQDELEFLKRSRASYKGKLYNKCKMKKLLILIIMVSVIPVKPLDKNELIDAIAAGSKLTKADAGFQLD